MSEKEADDFLASVRVMEANLGLFRSGMVEAYRPIATELRKLLCDNRSLLPRVFENLRLHKFSTTALFERCPSLLDGLAMVVPGQVAAAEGRPTFRPSFALPIELMPLDDWLEQPFLNEKMTVRELIKSVADKEGAHADPGYNDLLRTAKAIRFCSDESHWHSIAGLSEYLLEVLRRAALTVRQDVPLQRNAAGVWARA